LAFSIVILDCLKNPESILLQKRHPGKYHSGGLWSNACCGHPAPHECVEQAAHQRLIQEMGFSVPLTFLAQTEYRLDVGNHFIEYERNHIFMGEKDPGCVLHPHPEEVSMWKWMAVDSCLKDMRADPQTYSAWFPVIMQPVLKAYGFYKNE
jgi:isopentenyl-diphosphate delta-isomerase